MGTDAERVFTATAATYDEERARLIPGFARFYGWAVELVPAEARKVLDLGAGTGLLAETVRAKLPATRLELVDISEAMLARARVRFAWDEGVVFRVADYSAEEMTGGAVEGLVGGYDAVVSALSIHHLEDVAKRALFRRVWKWLRPGGVFVNADQVLGPTAALEARYRAAWLAGGREHTDFGDNWVVVKINQPEFEIRVTGFDTRRDLHIDAKVKEQEGATDGSAN